MSVILWDSFRSVVNHRELFFELYKRDLFNKVSGTWLGGAWLLVQPALQVLAFWFLIEVILKVRFPENTSFIAYFLSGMIPWLCIMEILQRSVNLFREFSSLYKKTAFPLILIPILSIIVAFSTYAIIYSLVIYMLFDITSAFYSVLLLLLVMVWLMPLVYIFSILGVFIKDVGKSLPFLLTITMYVSPILYMPQMIPEKYQIYLVFNPVADIMFLLHGFIENQDINYVPALLRLIAEWVLLIFVGGLLFNRAEKHIREVI